MAPGMAEAILSLLDTIGRTIIDLLPSPLNWLFAGVAGFLKGLIEELIA